MKHKKVDSFIVGVRLNDNMRDAFEDLKRKRDITSAALLRECIEMGVYENDHDWDSRHLDASCTYSFSPSCCSHKPPPSYCSRCLFMPSHLKEKAKAASHVVVTRLPCDGMWAAISNLRHQYGSTSEALRSCIEKTIYSDDGEFEYRHRYAPDIEKPPCCAHLPAPSHCSECTFNPSSKSNAADSCCYGSELKDPF